MSDLSVHNRVVERLFRQLYNRQIIDNVNRGVYVEYMVEPALQELDPAWECMPGVVKLGLGAQTFPGSNRSDAIGQTPEVATEFP